MTIVDWFRLGFSLTMGVVVLVNWRLSNRVERACKEIRESNAENMASNDRLVRALDASWKARTMLVTARNAYPSQGGQA